MSLAKLTKGERFIIDWQYGISGGFYTALAEAIARADDVNLSKLRKGFPDEVDAFLSYSRVDGWWERVRAKAKGE